MIVEKPLSKSAMLRELGWSESYFDSIPLPTYGIGKKPKYKLSDVPAAIELTKQEPKKWASSKTKNHRITSSHSHTKVFGIEEARKRIKEQMQKQSTIQNGDVFY